MSADDTPPVDPRVEALGQALNKAGATTSCPSCGHDKWMAHEHPVTLPNSGGADGGVMALAVGCEKCGFIRLHAAQVLDQYMDPRA